MAACLLTPCHATYAPYIVLTSFQPGYQETYSPYIDGYQHYMYGEKYSGEEYWEVVGTEQCEGEHEYVGEERYALEERSQAGSRGT